MTRDREKFLFDMLDSSRFLMEMKADKSIEKHYNNDHTSRSPLSTCGMEYNIWGNSDPTNRRNAMNRLIIPVVSMCVLLCCVQVFGTSWDTVVFREDFDSSVGGMPDPGDWVVNNPESWWWTEGRTHFPCPDPWLATGEFPRVEDGVCIIEHHLYNRWDQGDPNEWFLGGEIHTVLEFEPNRAYRIEARVRLRSDLPYPYVPYPDGLITSFFTYGYDGSNSDEIDFELLSNKMNDDENYPDGDPVLTNAWNESNECPEYIEPEDLDLTMWNEFRIYWYPDLDLPRIEWWWLHPINGWTWLRTEDGPTCVADEPMALYFNFWAPCYTSWNPDCDPWDEAADPLLQPVNTPEENEISAYEIDYVEVRTDGGLEPPCYADEVVIQTYDDNCCDPDLDCLYTPASRALGLPDWEYYDTVPGEWWKGSPGEGGEFVVKFSRTLVFDGSGPDLRFWQGDGDGTETATVSASRDGVTYELLGTLSDDVHSGGDPGQYGYYCDFNLTGTGLNAVRYVKVDDVLDAVDGAGIDGSDIDAIEALNCGEIPTISTWGLVVMTLFVLCTGTVVLTRRQGVKA